MQLYYQLRFINEETEPKRGAMIFPSRGADLGELTLT